VGKKWGRALDGSKSQRNLEGYRLPMRGGKGRAELIQIIKLIKKFLKRVGERV
jgi:hypothetical protein